MGDGVTNPASWWLLGASVWCASFTWNAVSPIRRVRELILPSFVAGWWTSEMPLHQLAWQALGTLVLIDLGALGAWPGVLGLGINVASWTVLVLLAIRATRVGEIFEHALTKDLGADYLAQVSAEVKRYSETHEPRARLFLPNRFADRRVRVHAGIQYAEGAGRRHQLDVHVPITSSVTGPPDAPSLGGTLKDGSPPELGEQGGRVTSPTSTLVKPKGAPVLFQVHGGGWVVGHKRQQGMPLVNHMAARGWVCVSANYRLSPRATFPDHLIDLKRALAWTRQHIAEYGGDPNFIVVTGGSAGGHLCTLLALTANDPEYQPGFENVDTRVQACVPFYGVYDFRDRNSLHKHRGLALVVNRAVMKSTPERDPDAFDRASPIARIHPDAPPFLAVHGDQDSMAPHEEARVFIQKLREVSRAKVAYVELPGAQHAFEVFHSIRTGHATAAVFRFLSMVHAEYLASSARSDKE